MLRSTYNKLTKHTSKHAINTSKSLGLSLKYSFGQKKHFHKNKKFEKRVKQKPKIEDFENFKRTSIPQKPSFLREKKPEQLETVAKIEIEGTKQSQNPDVQYKFDELLGIMVPLESTDMTAPLKNIDQERQIALDKKEFDQELQQVQKTKGKSMVKTMGRQIKIEAPKVKLTKYLSGASVMSTRAAKKLIKEGNILVNKKRVDQNIKVSDYDKVEIWTKNGLKYVGKEEARLWVFYKPRGIVCTDYDPHGRITVMDYLRESKQILGTPKQLKSMNDKYGKASKSSDYEDILREESQEGRNVDIIEHVIGVGRLDFNSEGLYLMTNDGDLARCLELPINKVERVSSISGLRIDFKALSSLFNQMLGIQSQSLWQIQ